MTDQETVRAVGEKVMGWTLKMRQDKGGTDTANWEYWKSLRGEVYAGWDPLTSLSDAGMLIEAMTGKGYFFHGSACGKGVQISFRKRYQRKTKATTTTHPLMTRAITLAALRALEALDD